VLVLFGIIRYVEKSIPAGHYMVIYGGIVQISTAGMGAQSRLTVQFAKAHCYRDNARKVCDKTSLTETHMTTSTITFR
jgi:hypothetical protein